MGDYKGCDLVHLALGGVMMNCGYDPRPAASTTCRRSRRRCGTPTTSPASRCAWRSWPRCIYRFRTGKGQQVSCAVHEAVSKCTEVDLMTWVMRRAPSCARPAVTRARAISPQSVASRTPRTAAG